MRKYIKIFQQAEPAIFRIYTKEADVFTEFLTNFIKPVVLSERNSIRKLKKSNFSSTENHLRSNLLSVGSIARKIVKNSRKDDETLCKFLNKAITAYSKCAAYMVEKLWLSNDFLKTVIAIDPAAILTKTTVTLKAILHLPDIVTNVLSSIGLEDYEKGCRKIMVDPTLPPALVEKKFVTSDTWWFKLKDKCPLLSKMSLALLIFHGPGVESSFSVMGDVMDKKSGRMNVSTYSAIQMVKYSLNTKTLHAFRPKSVQVFQRSDQLKSLVMSEVVEGITNSKKV